MSRAQTDTACHTARFVWVVIVLLASAPRPIKAEEMKITSKNPGNVFTESEKPTFQIPNALLTYVVKDYWGGAVAQGEARAEIRLAALPCGYYTLQCRTAEDELRASFAVLPERGASRLPKERRLAVDCASAWLCRPEEWDDLAEILRAAGINWVRERLRWGEVAPQKGKFEWGKYDAVASAFAKRGVNVYQIFHDSPGWTLPTTPKHQTRCPRDLRDAYFFAKTGAEHFAGRIDVWEVWNEPDIAFWPDLSDRFAAVQKAACLGFHDGNPNAHVVLASLCRGPSPFADNLFACGVADYFEIFNYHTYSPPERYLAQAEHYRGLLRKQGVADRPVWITEAGIRLESDKGVLSDEAEKTQAEFVPKSFAMSLAAGIDRHFFFIYPYFLEGKIQFGSLRKDLTPRPAFVAVATGVRILGSAEYLGEYRADDKRFTAHVFTSGAKTLMVIWSDKEQTVDIPTGAGGVEVVDLVGRTETRKTTNGMLSLRTGPAAQYLIGLKRDALGDLSGPIVPRGKIPEANPSRIVVVGHADLAELDKNQDCYVVTPGQEFEFVIDLYNFNPKDRRAGRIRVGGPPGWEISPIPADAAVDAMGRQEFTLSVKTGPPASQPQIIRVTADFDRDSVAPSISRFRY